MVSNTWSCRRCGVAVGGCTGWAVDAWVDGIVIRVCSRARLACVYFCLRAQLSYVRTRDRVENSHPIENSHASHRDTRNSQHK